MKNFVKKILSVLHKMFNVIDKPGVGVDSLHKKIDALEVAAKSVVEGKRRGIDKLVMVRKEVEDDIETVLEELAAAEGVITGIVSRCKEGLGTTQDQQEG